MNREKSCLDGIQMKFGKEVGKTIECYVDSVDFECEAESIETLVHPDLFGFPKDGCTRSTYGVYKVKIQAIEYLSPEQIDKLIDNDENDNLK